MIEDRKLDDTSLFRVGFSSFSFVLIFFFRVGLFCIVVIHDCVEHFGDGWGNYFEDFVLLLSGEFWELFIHFIPDGFVEKDEDVDHLV